MAGQIVLELASGDQYVQSDLLITSRTVGAQVILPDGIRGFAYGLPAFGFADEAAITLRLQGLMDAGARAKLTSQDACRLILPIGVLRDDGRVVGFISRSESRGLHPSLLEYFSGDAGGFPPELLDLPNRVRIARQLARCFAAFHFGGATIGAFDPAQVRLVIDNGEIHLINAFAFGLASSTGVTRSPLGALPMYRPLEVRDRLWQEVSWTTAQDNFELAVVIFQLLSFGRHPFGPVPGVRDDLYALRPRQEEGLYWPQRLGCAWMPESLARLFELAFLSAEPEGRPTASEWVDALDIPTGREGYDRCSESKDSRHGRYAVFAQHECPLCRPYKGADVGPSVESPLTAPGSAGLPPIFVEPKAMAPATGALSSWKLVVVLLGVCVIALYLLVTSGDASRTTPISAAEAESAPSAAASAVASTVNLSEAPPPKPGDAASPSVARLALPIPDGPGNALIDKDGEPSAVALRVQINQPYAEKGLSFPLAIDLHYYFTRLSWYKPLNSSSEGMPLSPADIKMVERLRSRLREKQEEVSRVLAVSDQSPDRSNKGWGPYRDRIDIMLASAFSPDSTEFFDAWLWLKSNEPAEVKDLEQDKLRLKLEPVSSGRVEDKAAAALDYSNLKTRVLNRAANHLALAELALASKRLDRPMDEGLALAFRAVMGRPNIGATWLALASILAERDQNVGAQAICVANRVTNGNPRVSERIQALSTDDGVSVKVRGAAAIALQRCLFKPFEF